MRARAGPGLRRALGPGMLAVLVVGDILGAGIYILVGEVAAEVGGLAWLAFLGAFALAAVTASSYVELVTKYPSAAGSAHYVDRAFRRPFPTFLVGVAVVAATLSATSTTARAAGGDYLAELVELPVTPVAVAAVVGLSLVNHWGISESARANLVMTVVELAGLLLVIVVGAIAVAVGDGDPGRALESGGAEPGALGLLGAIALAFFAFLGFEDSVHLSEEVRDPARAYPRALLGGLAVTGVVYLLVTLVAAMVVAPAVLADSSGPLLEVVSAAPVQVPPELFSVIALVAVLNTALLTLVTASRLVYGLADQGALPRALAWVHPGRRTPTTAVVATGVVAALLAATGELGGLAETTVVLLLLVFAAVNVSVLVLRRDTVDRPHWSAPALLPVVGAVASVVLAGYRLVEGAATVSLRAALLVGAGCLLYVVNRRFARIGGR